MVVPQAPPVDGRPPESLSEASLAAFCATVLAPYQAPRVYKFLPPPGLPRNAMGKVNKKQLVATFFGDWSSSCGSSASGSVAGAA